MKLLKELKLVFLLISAFYYKKKAASKGLIGQKFDNFGRKLSWKYLLKFNFGKFFQLLLNPVSITRYFEFDYVFRNIDFNISKKILDVSSPRLFGLYTKKYYPYINYTMINPNKRDLELTKEYFEIFENENLNFFQHDAKKLPFNSNYYNIIICISVIEHIPDKIDLEVIKELWRVLKPNGKMVMTFPVSKIYKEEYRQDNIYQLKQIKKNSKGYFFQRFYDLENVKKRILEPIEIREFKNFEIFGEKEANFYKKYRKRWIENGLKETIKDPWYISNNFIFFKDLNDLPEFGVMGIVIEKN